MSSFLSELGGLTAGVGAEGLAFAAGFAASHALEPEAYTIAVDAWKAAQVKRLDPQTAAEAAAEALASETTMADEAAHSGIDGSRFAYLYDLALTAPGEGTLIQLLRRNSEVSIDFAHGLRKSKLEPQWDDALKNLRDVRIPAPDLAYMVVRGVVPDGGTLPGALPTHGDNLQLPPQLALDTLTEASLTGWDKERFAGLVARSGLAMAPVMAAQAYFRGILTRNDYDLTIARGDLYPAFADPVLQVSRQIPTAGEAVQYQLRGFTDAAGRYALTDLHGMSHAYSDVLYDIAGRAPSDRQVYIGLARGAKYPATYADVPSPFREAIQRSDIRPEFADIVYQNRYSLPSAFVVRSLLTDGAIDQTRGSTILQHEGWPADLADLVAAHYAAKSGGGGDAHVGKAQNQLWSTTHRSYVGEMIDNPTATAALTAVGVSSAAVQQVLTLWAHERSLTRKQLTPAQVKKAYGEGTFTLAEATQMLLDRGYDQSDATVLLEE